MSIQRVNPLLQSFRSDGHISLNEAKTLACPNKWHWETLRQRRVRGSAPIGLRYR